MIDPAFFGSLLAEQGTDFFTGVPDSLLKNFCAWLSDNAENNHIAAVNEGSAVAIAAGYHLASGKIPLVYMQNSGIGNAANPLLSLTDLDVFSIPLILLVGWRGEPGVKDEPQHLKQGKVTCSLFDTMGIPYLILDDQQEKLRIQIEECYKRIRKNSVPFALIVRNGTFLPYNAAEKTIDTDDSLLSREEALEEIMRRSSPSEVFISTTGMVSRELYELREKYHTEHERDFLVVGSMGHASSLALSLALQKPKLPVNCVDGDGAALMHLGSIATIGACKPSNLRHFVLNNGAHDSVGAQPTISRKIDLSGIARSCGYSHVFTVKTLEELHNVILFLSKTDNAGPSFIEVHIRTGSRKDLGRPRSSPMENKEEFMRFVKGENHE